MNIYRNVENPRVNMKTTNPLSSQIVVLQPRSVGSLYKSVLGKTANHDSPPLINNGELITGNNDKAEIFNKIFLENATVDDTEDCCQI